MTRRRRPQWLLGESQLRIQRYNIRTHPHGHPHPPTAPAHHAGGQEVATPSQRWSSVVAFTPWDTAIASTERTCPVGRISCSPAAARQFSSTAASGTVTDVPRANSPNPGKITGNRSWIRTSFAIKQGWRNSTISDGRRLSYGSARLMTWMPWRRGYKILWVNGDGRSICWVSVLTSDNVGTRLRGRGSWFEGCRKGRNGGSRIPLGARVRVHVLE